MKFRKIVAGVPSAPDSDKTQFDDTLKRMLSTPPEHKPRTKTGVPKKLKPR